MNRTIRMAAACLAALSAGALAAAKPAGAALKLELWDGVGPSIVIQDNMPGDADATDGVVRYSGGVGAFIINITTGFSKPVLGNPVVAEMDVRSLEVSGAAGSIRIRLTDTDFDQSAVNFATLTIGGISDGTIGYNAYVDPSNAEFGTTGVAESAGTIGPLGPGFFTTFLDTLILPPLNPDAFDPYSMTMELTIVHTGALQRSNVNANMQMTSVPFDVGRPMDVAIATPAGFALMIPGLIFLGLRRGHPLRWR